MKIIGTTGQHSVLGEFFCYQELPWFRLGIRGFVVLVGVISFACPETIFASGADSSPTIRVRVNNYTQASPRHISWGRTRSWPNPRQSWFADSLVRLPSRTFHR
jgi:hypothetical protein